MSVLSQHHSIKFDWVISAHGNGKEVVNVINAIDKQYLYKLMSTVQLPGSKTFYSQIIIHSCTHKKDASLAKQFQKHLYKEHHKHGWIDQVKYSKIPTKRKWTYREYHDQDNTDISHKYVKMYCDTN